ncbi:MAG: FAD:protein FMN transferase ApbE [Candidatus Contendobacter odensis]|uniref:FAD:protein FMN transferase n=1 Tax=Candidatus Contendibacter odensensis TaxID=1400860 RepID=A0A2G6PFK5_9GAMM|nr:MAG: FAD:protein FMN transferase ApbE [Candidatus Contendobacter odensis]
MPDYPHRHQRILLLFIFLILAACKPFNPVVRITGTTMGTRYDLKLVPAPGQEIPADFNSQVETLLARINQRMSTYDPRSELSQFNQTTRTDWITVSPELQYVISEALYISELSDGAFDITIGSLVNLWSFGPPPHHDHVPSTQAINQARAQVGYWHLHTRKQPPALKKDRANLYVDLSAIAKGYGVDQLAALVDNIGIDNYLVSIGGEIRTKGRNSRGKPWTIAIEKPIPGQRAIERLIRIGDHSVSTSGDYRNFFEQDGQRYSHIIDPRTGRPTPQTLASVTVISNRSIIADATATALMAAGAKAGFEIATRHHLAAFFILTTANGFKVRHTTEFIPYLLSEVP